MRMRSTGLGRTELVGDVIGLKRMQDYLILYVDTTKPVRWHVRTAMCYSDIMRVLKLLLKPEVILYILGQTFKRKKVPVLDDF